MIDKHDVKALFQKMQDAGWNMQQAQVWGYFFKDSSEQKLIKLSHKLKQLGYTINDINQSYPDKSYWLHIEKIQQHSIESLHQLNQYFYQLAKDNNISSYDGMDISPIDI
ncbi:MAG: ribonuclease E inhibitor RraB [Pseudomonadota bacterium]